MFKTIHEWQSIDDKMFEDCNVGEIVSVSKNLDYLEKMETQNKKVLAILKDKYQDKDFRLSKWNNHDFGHYQEVEESVAYEIEICELCEDDIRDCDC